MPPNELAICGREDCVHFPADGVVFAVKCLESIVVITVYPGSGCVSRDEQCAAYEPKPRDE